MESKPAALLKRCLRLSEREKMGARNVLFVFVRVSACPCCHDLDGILAGRRIVDIVNTFVKYLNYLESNRLCAGQNLQD